LARSVRHPLAPTSSPPRPGYTHSVALRSDGSLVVLGICRL
jgi:hypothetical protein